MKKYTLIKTAIILTLVFLTLLIHVGCKKIQPENESFASAPVNTGALRNGAPARKFRDTIPLDQLIVWQKPEATPEQVQQWISDSLGGLGNVIQERFCVNCDVGLLLLSGPGIKNYISGDAASGGKSSPGVPSSGDVGPAYISLNFPMRGKPSSVGTIGTPYFPPPVINTNKKIKLAVLDTGIDTFAFNNYQFNPNTSPTPCILKPGAGKGWNFVANNNNFFDDDLTTKHGSTVTRFITDQADKYKKNRIEILPAKTHNAEGVSDLATILCAFAYAQHAKVKIINGSFGFYLPKHPKDPAEPDVRLLREYVKYYLTRNRILLVAAAGNIDTVNEPAAFKLYNLKPPPAPLDRNLDYVNFWPASLARDTTNFWNVIAVTTVDLTLNGGSVCPSQNYSPNVVDIGVDADTTIFPNAYNLTAYVFNNPRLTGPGTVEGTSFAAPIISGKLCANYDSIRTELAKARPSKTVIFRKLNLSTVIVSVNANLKKYVRGGRFVRKNKGI